MEEIYLYRSAAAMIKQHGENASMEAALKSDAMLKKGDTKGAKVWRDVIKRIDILQARKPDNVTQH
ncbi:MAG: hypothetical protein HY052_03740 [Proteobacteria bacterium]|nr:hypothetical protein [Pseudomonadota bacterium]